jgi:phosphoribosylaminoimidazole carboxylase/phosphoribosylaminoimidazole-succinocarboxamide synthase
MRPETVQKGKVLAEGKTKVVYEAENEPDLVILGNKDEITKNDNPAETRTMISKAEHATTTTSAMFGLLEEAGIPVAFEARFSKTEFLARNCKMLLLEVVLRRYAVGSFLKRFPHMRREGNPYRFHRLEFELFLKTTKGKILNLDGAVCGETPVEDGRPLDDPFIANPYNDVWKLLHPKKPLGSEASDLHCPVFRTNILPPNITVRQIEELARKTFLVLEGAWTQCGLRLIDLKIEVGINPRGELVVADVIDNDSWRLQTVYWEELSKQLFRDNADMDKIADAYALVAGLVERLRIPEQVLVTWRGSDKDTFLEIPDVAGIEEAYVVSSGHKSTSKCLAKLEETLADHPEGGVIIAVVGMSDGLGPMLAARTSWPVIAVPATAKERPHDVWSSLEMPSGVPLLTVLSPKNAVLAALNILAQKNPAAYMHRQYAIEELDN